MLYVLALHAASNFMQLPRKPPVTASLILANTVVYWRPGVLDVILPTVDEVCLSPYLVLKNFDVKRLFLSAFYHMDDAHLVYNSECAVGFSAVLFAMKMVLNWDSPDFTNVYGVLLPSRYAAWAELFLIQMFVPGTSFLGHLCGILAGLIYVNSGPLLRGSFSPFVWVKRLIQRPLSIVSWPFAFLLGWRRQRRIHGRGTAGHENRLWRCRVCTFDNGGLREDCEMCGSPRGVSPDSPPEEPDPSAPPWPGEQQSWPPTVEELRRARLARFNRGTGR